MTGIVPKTQWTKARKDGLTQGLGFAKVSPFFFANKDLK
jgi:hypothetical protein